MIYLDDLKLALTYFPLIALVVTIPYYLLLIKNNPHQVLLRVLLFYSFVFYALCAYYLVVFPLPTRSELASMTPQKSNLIPFSFFREYAKSGVVLSKPSTWKYAFTSFFVLQYVFNILLLLPYGCYLNYYFGFGWKKTLVIAALTSLFFEISQRTGLFGIYPFAYRDFDVDDIICNTSGAMIGWFLVRHFRSDLPDLESKAAGKAFAGRSYMLRRLLAILVDLGIILSVLWAAGAMLWASGQAERAEVFLDVRAILPFAFLYFVLLTVLFHATPGKLVTGLKVTRDGGGRPRLRDVLLRYLIPFCGLGILAALYMDVLKVDSQSGLPVGRYGFESFFLIMLVIVLFETILNLTHRGRDYSWGKISHTRLDLTVRPGKGKRREKRQEKAHDGSGENPEGKEKLPERETDSTREEDERDMSPPNHSQI